MEKLPTILIPPTILAGRVEGQDYLQRTLNQTLRPLGLHHKPPKGHSETQFERDLWRYFPGKIHTGLMVQRPGYNQPYLPDFAYIDPVTHLHIDIEVDEPYSHTTRQPLHYQGCTKDQQRNQFFLDSGWLVIRFSEAQVVKLPTSCCKAIAATIATLTNDNTLMHPFRQVPTLKPEPRWTKTEAEQMAEAALRETYTLQSESEPTKRRRKKLQKTRQISLISANFTFYCPVCGEGPIRWQGHYIQCPTCSYDAFAL